MVPGHGGNPKVALVLLACILQGPSGWHVHPGDGPSPLSLLSLSLHHNAKLCQANTSRISIKMGTFSFYSHIQLKAPSTSQWLPLQHGLAVRALEPYIHFTTTAGLQPVRSIINSIITAPWCGGLRIGLLSHVGKPCLRPHSPRLWGRYSAI
jgi:hypothetical protein